MTAPDADDPVMDLDAVEELLAADPDAAAALLPDIAAALDGVDFVVEPR